MDRGESTAWLRQFLRARSLDGPDPELPLYAYRCGDDEFKELPDLLLSAGRPPIGRSSGHFRENAAVFCLYAAEWWRRTHKGGPWKWSGILEGVGWEGLPPQLLYEIVEEGLGYWRRPLLRVGPNRGFLVTLACEGGLPLNLVTSEGTKLRDYLLAVLDEFQICGSSGYAPEELAARASERLPRSLRQDVVYRLCGQLIEAIWRLQRRVRGATTPVQELDRTDPDWRARLPLLVDDRVARALLNPLVEEAVKLARGGPVGLRMRRSLRIVREDWVLHGEVVVPTSVSAAQLVDLFRADASEIPARFELYIEDDSGAPAPLALATRTMKGDTPVFALEALDKVTRTEGQLVCRDRKIHAEFSSGSLGPVPLPGSSTLTVLPWVFVEKAGENRELVFLGQGSITTRHAEAFVAVPWDTTAEVKEGGECELVSEITTVERAVYRVRGCSVFFDPEDADGNVCRVRTAATENASPEYRLNGERLLGVSGGQYLFRGPPGLLAIHLDGEVERVASERVQWCASGHRPIVWRPLSAECYGEVDLRFVDGSTLRHRDHALVVPKSAEIELRPTSDFKKGAIHLIGFKDAKIVSEESSQVEVRQEESVGPGIISLNCKALADPPAQVAVRLDWLGGRSLELVLPYPSVGSRFIRADGAVIDDDEVVAVDRLQGLVAIGTEGDGGGGYYISGSLSGADVSSAQVQHFRVEKPLKQVMPRRFELDLRALKEQLRNLFAVSKDLDACVRLVIHQSQRGDGGSRRLRVLRFDISLEPEWWKGEVKLSPEALRRLSLEELDRLELETVPLWDPGAEADILESCSRPLALGCWSFNPRYRAAGPWLVLGRGNSRDRVRPLLWDVPGKDDDELLAGFEPSTSGALTTAIRISDKEARARAIARVLAALADDYSHEDWRLVYEYLREFRSLPASTLDLMEGFIDTPQAAIGALMGAPDGAVFAEVWSLLEELPFLWSLLPVREWMSAGRRFEASLRKQLQGDSGDVDAVVQEAFAGFFKEAPARRPGFETLTELLRVSALGDDIRRTTYLKLVAGPTGRAALRGQLYEARQTLLRLHVDDRWPAGSTFHSWLRQTSELPEEICSLSYIESQEVHYRVPVLRAPAVAAFAAAVGISVDRPLIYELRRLRAFDDRWFDTAYSYMLAITIGVLLKSDPARIGLDT